MQQTHDIVAVEEEKGHWTTSPRNTAEMWLEVQEHLDRNRLQLGPHTLDGATFSEMP